MTLGMNSEDTGEIDEGTDAVHGGDWNPGKCSVRGSDQMAGDTESGRGGRAGMTNILFLKK